MCDFVAKLLIYIKLAKFSDCFLHQNKIFYSHYLHQNKIFQQVILHQNKIFTSIGTGDIGSVSPVPLRKS